LVRDEYFFDFEGVESAFYCWINGKLVGYSEDSRLPAHFNILPHLKKGENNMIVKVFKTINTVFPKKMIRIRCHPDKSLQNPLSAQSENNPFEDTHKH